jgi:hypothetical protein
MKVLKQPEDVKAWAQKCGCPRCTAELEYVLQDVIAKHNSSDQRDLQPSYWSYEIICAVCQQRIEIGNKGMSKYIEHLAQARSRSTYSGGYKD